MKVFLLDVITAQMARDVVSQLEDANGEDVEVVIFSEGGNILAGNAIIHALRNSGSHITTNVIGLAASMAAIISQSGHKRLISPDASFNIHNGQMPVDGRGTKEDHIAAAETLAVMDGQMRKALNKSTLDNDSLSLLMAQDRLLSAEEAIELGFFDAYSEPVLAVAKLNKSIHMNKLDSIKRKLNIAAIKLGFALAVLTDEEAARMAELEAKETRTPEEEEELVMLVAKAAEGEEAAAVEGEEIAPPAEETGAEILTSDMVSREEFDTFKAEVMAVLEQVLAAIEIAPSEEQMVEVVETATTAKMDNVLRAIRSKTQIPTAQQNFQSPKKVESVSMAVLNARIKEKQINK